MESLNITINQGWECPKCKRVYAPNQPMCLFCVPATTETATVVTTPTDNYTNNIDEYFSEGYPTQPMGAL